MERTEKQHSLPSTTIEMTNEWRINHQNVSQQRRFISSDVKKEKMCEAVQQRSLQMSVVEEELQEKQRHSTMQQKHHLTEEHKQPCSAQQKGQRTKGQSRPLHGHSELNNVAIRDESNADGETDRLLILAQLAELLMESENNFSSDGNRQHHEVLSPDQEQKLQAVRVHLDKDLGVLLPKESGRTSGPPPDPSSFGRTGPPWFSSKRKAVDREVIRARLSSRSTPPSKAARIDNASSGNSPPVTFKASSLLSTPSAGPQACPHWVASPVVSPQPTTSSVTIAIPESSSLAIPSAPHSCPPCSGTSTGAPTGAGPMLGNPLVIREKLERFLFPPEVMQINTLSTEGVIDMFLEGLVQASTASVCLLSRARSHSQLKQDNETMQKELSVAQGKITALEAAGRASEADLTAIRERATRLETELSAAHERAAKVEAELVKARERASLSEAELIQTRKRVMLRETIVETEMRAAHERASQVEMAVLAEKDLANGLADVFIDGYEELRGNISAAFSDIDLSDFVPTEAPDDNNGNSDDIEDDDDAEDDAEDDGDSYE